ncbi:MAG TPA: hypothetical protein VF392_04265 [Terracidiphilus sp.]
MRIQDITVRFWSLIAAWGIAWLGFTVSIAVEDSLSYILHGRSVWLLCATVSVWALLIWGLLINSWRKQRRALANRWWRLVCIHFLLLPALLALYWGLHVIQVSTYDLAVVNGQFVQLHFQTGYIKDRIFWLVPIDFLMLLVWGILAIGNSLFHRNAASA